MKLGKRTLIAAALQICLGLPLLAQTSEQAVAVVIANRTMPSPDPSEGAAVVIRPNGILLTSFHVVKDAYSLQVRFKNGEVYDQVQLLGVDLRRDVAAIRIPAAALPTVPIAISNQVKPGDAVSALLRSNEGAWTPSKGVVTARQLSDEIPRAGSGYRVVEFSGPEGSGSRDGVLFDNRGNALGLIVRPSGYSPTQNFAVPIDSVFGLGDAPITQIYPPNGYRPPVSLVAAPPRIAIPAPMAAAPVRTSSEPEANLSAPEKSEVLSESKDPKVILKNFKTVYVDARRAKYFKADQMKAALGRNKEFAKLNIRIVDDIKLADTVLDVGYTFAWDYPFELRHQNTTTVLVSGKGLGPFSGVVGAASVAEELTKALRPYRTTK